MYLLIMKNYDKRLAVIEKNTSKEHWFPTVQAAEERASSLMSQKDVDGLSPKYTAFATMELNYFIETTVARWGLAT